MDRTSKIDPITDSTGTVFKRGFHLLIPGICLTRPHKKYIIHQLKSSARLDVALRNLGVIDGAKSLDENSASVPVLFLGSCKSNSMAVYKLSAIYQVMLTYIRPQEMDIKDEPYVEVTKTKGSSVPDGEEKSKPKYNLAYELSLTCEMKGGNKLIPKVTYKSIPELDVKIDDHYARTMNGKISDAELFMTENQVNALVQSSPDALHIQGLLSILTPEYYIEYDKWIKVIYALANSSDSRICYKPLAAWFSQKCAEKWKQGGEQYLDKLWESTKIIDNSRNRLTVKSIDYWARICDPIRYEEITRDGYFAKLQKYIYDCRGVIENAMVSDILHSLLRHKFYAEPEGKGEVWYEFVTDKDHGYKPGELWKWRREPNKPVAIEDYMTKELPGIYNRAMGVIVERRQKAETKEKAKYFTEIIKSLEKSRLRLYQNMFINNTVKRCVNNFIYRGFSQKLDKTCPNIFGVGNGVLVMGRDTQFIDHFHEYAVSKYTTVMWKKGEKFNPLSPIPIQAKLLGMIADIIIEPDARVKIMMFLSTGLVGSLKNLPLLLMTGSGCNGKSVLMAFMRKVLQSHYASAVNSQVYCSQPESADRPNSAIMQFDGKNLTVAEENNKEAKLNSLAIKNLNMSFDISNRDLNEKQRSFQITATQIATSNYDYVVESNDDGTWRRLQLYETKSKFTVNPDPKNEFEVKMDEKFMREYPDDPSYQLAWLQILVYFYERFQNEYNGLYNLVPSATIDKCTESFRNKYDLINRFINEFVVYSPKYATGGEDALLDNIAAKYRNWCGIYHSGHRLGSYDQTIKDFENSSLQKQLRRNTDKPGKYETFGVRFLERESKLLDGEVYYRPRTVTEFGRAKKDNTPNWWLPATAKHESKAAPMSGEYKDVKDSNVIINNESSSVDQKSDFSILDDDKQYVNVKKPVVVAQTNEASVSILDDIF